MVFATARGSPVVLRPFLWYATYPMRVYIGFLLLIASAASVFAQDLKPLADRLPAQNALFDEQYESDLRNFPERATAFGDYRYNDRLNDYSLDAIMRRHEENEAFLKHLEAIPTACAIFNGFTS